MGKRGRPPLWRGGELESVKSQMNYLYHTTDQRIVDIAKMFKCSHGTVSRLLMTRVDWEAWEIVRKTRPAKSA